MLVCSLKTLKKCLNLKIIGFLQNINLSNNYPTIYMLDINCSINYYINYFCTYKHMNLFIFSTYIFIYILCM